jgi:hypothetical protein
MATAFSESAPSNDQQQPHSQSFINIDDVSSTQWPRQYDTPVSRLRSSAAAYPGAAPYPPDSTDMFDYSPNGLPYLSNNNITYAPLNVDPSCPRSSFLNGMGLAGPLGNMNISESYPPSAYVIDPSQSHDGMQLTDQNNSHLMQLSNDYESHYIKAEDSPYGSPFDSGASTRSSTPHDGYPMMTPRDLKNEGVEEDNGIDKEQPYAQLIYRALMEAPERTMILRDIYNWFKENTDKAADKETKGWQNSIRHNLSMNGVCLFLLLAHMPRFAHTDHHRRSRRSTSPARTQGKASCGSSPTRPYARASNRQHATEASSRPKEAPVLTTRCRNDKHPEPKAAKQPSDRPKCAARSATMRTAAIPTPTAPSPALLHTTPRISTPASIPAYPIPSPISPHLTPISHTR